MGTLVHAAQLDGAWMHLGAQAGQLQHFLVAHLVQFPGVGHDARISGVDALDDVRVNLAAVGTSGRRRWPRRWCPSLRGPG